MLPHGHVSELSMALQMVLHHLREGDVPAAGDEVNSRTNSGFRGPGNHSISHRRVCQSNRMGYIVKRLLLTR
jgi:hypothetical protein